MRLVRTVRMEDLLVIGCISGINLGINSYHVVGIKSLLDYITQK